MGVDVDLALAGGPPALLQREVVEGGGSLVDVVDSLIQELDNDMPMPRGASFEAVGARALAAAD